MHKRLFATICDEPFFFWLQPFNPFLRRSNEVQIAKPVLTCHAAIRHKLFQAYELRNSNPPVTFKRYANTEGHGRIDTRKVWVTDQVKWLGAAMLAPEPFANALMNNRPFASITVGRVGSDRVAGPSVTLPWGSKVEPWHLQ